MVAARTHATTFDELQSRLGEMWALNKPGVGVDHVLILLPSFSVGESLLSHYTTRIPSLEHRYLVGQLIVHRISRCEVVFVTCAPPGDEVTDYYLSLLPQARRAEARSRLRVFVVPDRTGRSVAAKLLDRPDLLDELRRSLRGRPALIEPWNVTAAEVDVALRLDVPMYGSAPDLWPLGFKSAGRKLFARCGVPVALGYEDVRTPDDVVEAILSIRRAHPDAPGAVLKLDDSGAGDGNVIIDLHDGAKDGDAADAVRARVDAVPDWFCDELTRGGVVEELIRGDRFTSPSVQVDIQPDGEPVVLSTHEQVLGGDSGQVYVGCRFPADASYAAELARYGRAVGIELAGRGARGRLSVDFAAAQLPSGRWNVVALEINLRKGGTTHPYAVLRNLVPGTYSPEAATWISADGTPRFYTATDNLVDDRWCSLEPAEVISAVRQAGLEFDIGTGRGVVLHMFSGLGIDGRIGLTAIGRTPEDAAELYESTATTVRSIATR